MEQRVSRAHLRSPESTPEPESDPEVIHRLKRLGDLEYIHQNPTETSHGPTQNEEDEDQMEFQLFATSKPEAPTTTKIRLRSPTPQSTEPGFINPERDKNYYFATPLDPSQKEHLIHSAVSGDEILSRSHAPHPGMAYPWKVLHLPLSSLSREARIQSVSGTRLSKVADDVEKKKRTRPGKAYRIKLRTRAAEERAKKEEAAKLKEGKEAAEREKRMRRNREKKMRREKERAKKAAAAAGGEGGEGAGEAGDGDDDVGGEDEDGDGSE
jgi:hypothetical protein